MKKEYIVKQKDRKDCGVCALLSVIKYYHGYVPLEKLRLETFTNKEGTTAYHLIKAAQKYGFDATGIKATDIYNPQLIWPAIAHFRLANGLEHFVVIYKINNKKIIIMDPAVGYQTLNCEAFNQLWTKTLIMLVPATKIIKMARSQKLYELFFDMIRIEKKLILKITGLTIFLTILSIIASYYYKVGLNSLATNSITKISYVILAFVLLNIIKVLSNYSREKSQLILKLHMAYNITVPFLQHLLLLPLNSIKTRTTGEITTRYDETQNIKDLMAEIFTTIFLDILLSFVFFVILFLINNQLFFILCLILIIYCLIGFLVSPNIYHQVLVVLEAETNFNANLIEKIEGLETIKNTNTISQETESLRQQKFKLLNKQLRFQKLVIFYQFWQNFITEVGLCLITSYGFILIFKQQLTMVDLLTFNTLMYYLFEPLRNLINLLPKYYYLRASFQKISDFFAIPEEKITTKTNDFRPGDIIFHNINFSYNNYLPVLDNFNLTIKNKEHIMLQGPSGGGKSTICKLLASYGYKYHGNINIGGINICDYDLMTLRTNINYLSQDEKIFTDTIKNNILFHQEQSIANLNKVINTCCLQEVLDQKPLRLETIIQADGSNISGGERQRIILARALLRNCPILIFDEALSEVSMQIEQKIIKNIRNNYQDKTIIYVSHKNHQKLFDRVVTIN